MLKKIYVDNYKCLVNFELNFSNLSLLLGDNGSGKSTVFEVLSKLKDFLSGEYKVSNLFPWENVNSWDNNPYQVFNLELDGPDGEYKFELKVQHDREKRLVRVLSEKLFHNQKPVFEFIEGTAQLFHDDYSPGPKINFDGSQSGIALFISDKNKKATWFKEEVARYIVTQINPIDMWEISHEEVKSPYYEMTNFASWYRFLVNENQVNVFEVISRLKEIIPGFNSFKLESAGEDVKTLKVNFHDENNGNLSLYSFKELSDGQRALIILYFLLYGLKDMGYSVFIDEPENFIAIQEIQPWLMELSNACETGSLKQAVLISHHPELLDYMGPSSGILLYREPNSPTRIKYELPEDDSGLKLSERIARGWIDG